MTHYTSPYDETKGRSALGFIVFLAALVALEVFNVGTSYAALKHFLHGAKVAGVSWATMLTVGFYIPDVGGMYALVTGVTRRRWWVFGTWAVAATINIVLSWYALRVGALAMGGALASMPEADTLAIAAVAGVLRFATLAMAFIIWRRWRQLP